MALFIIVCGALLMIGGATSLLAGFDIVMTERGAAMTLGGVVALSGGLVAVGIGFALLRLSQILRALETRAGKAAKGTVQERPVVPVVTSDTVEPVLAKVGADNDVLPSLKMRAAVGAGVAAAAGIAGGVGLARHTDSTDAQAHVELQSVDLPAVPAAVDIPAESIAAVPLDLEAELARALAEPETSEPPLEAAKDDSFGNGLSAFLARSSEKKRGSEDIALGRAKVEDVPVSHDNDAAAKDALPAPPEALEPPEAMENRSLLIAEVPNLARQSADRMADDPETVEEPTEAESRLVPDNGEPQAISDGSDDEGVLADAHVPRPDVQRDDPELEADATGSEPIPSTGVPGDLPSASPRKPEVLGTYNTGGRTYSMYADGTVEAVTEYGVERFTSMDELRKHLSKV